MNDLSRRRFLQGVLAATTVPLWARLTPAWSADSPGRPDAHLLVIFLAGGNDGLNTVVPIGDPAYPRMRPKTGLRADEVLPIGGGLALHGSLTGLRSRWGAGELAVIQGVGPTVADLSHFSATETWETASPTREFRTGWLGRYLDASADRSRGPVRAVGIGPVMPRMLSGGGDPAITVRSLSDLQYVDHGRVDGDARHEAFELLAASGRAEGPMIEQVRAAQRRAIEVVAPISAANAGNTNEPGAAKTVAQLFGAGLGTEIGFVTISGFDTHAVQRGAHGYRLAELDSMIANFFAEARRLAVDDRSAVLVLSEFGRRVPENGSDGTDHGHGGTALVVGPPVRGGVYGNPPDLGALVDGNVPVTMDVRSLYASVLEQHLAADAEPILGGSFSTLPLFS